MKNKLIKSIIGFYIVVLLLSFYISFSMSSKFSKESDDMLKLYCTDFSDGVHDMSYRLLKQDETGTIIYTARFNAQKLPKTDDSNYRLLIYGQNAQGYTVKFNGAHIGTAGDPIDGRSNIWNAMYCFDLDKSLIRESNTLQIHSYSEYETGGSKNPVIITTPARARELHSSYDLLISRMIDIFMGFIFFAVFIILLLYFMSDVKRSDYLYFAIGVLLIIPLCEDFSNIVSLPCSYLAYKKITVLTGFLSIACFSRGISVYFKSKICKYAAYFLLVGATLITLFSQDMVTFKHWYNIFSIFNIPVFCIWLWVTLKCFKESDAAKVLCATFCFLMLFGTYNMLALVYAKYFYINSPVFYQILIAVVPFLFIILDNQEKNELMETQRKKTAAAYVASMTDRMTGLCNHYCIVTILDTFETPFYLILIDVDNFKAINDTRGHIVGDVVIKYLAEKMKECFSKKAVLCRYGGDEFIIVHFGNDLCEVQDKLEEYRALIKSVPIENQKTQDVNISCGIYYVAEHEDVSTMIHRADIAMYHAKKQGKNQVSIYSSQM